MPKADVGILDLLQLAGFNANPTDKIVRHQHRRYPVSDLLRQNLLETYQSYQSDPVFHHAKQIVSLYGLDGTRACFFGVFRNNGHRGSKEVSPCTSSALEIAWREETNFCYQLERLGGFEHLENRVIVEWGPGALAWHQKLRNKTVLELTAPGRALPPFDDYLEFSLTHDDLRRLYANEEAHREWRSRLSAVAGVYLILAETRGELYIGSAYGAEGIWGRWRCYAKTGHGGNQLLRALISSNPEYPDAFRYSILQIVPKSMTGQDVIKREAQFKLKLGSRAHGLNLN
jgi:hypothetical protein